MGTWSDIFEKRQTLIDNHYLYKNRDGQHLIIQKISSNINRILAIPIYQDGKIIAIVANVNKSSDYTANEVFNLINLYGVCLDFW